VSEQPLHQIPSERLPGFQAENKANYVKSMFDQIAPRYDLMNRLMTFGQDQSWRRYVVRQAAPPIGGLALDVATGTGDIAIELAHAIGYKGQVVASDFSLEMMQPGPAKAAKAKVGQQVKFMAADALHLPFPNNTFDCITTGFAMRNVVDIQGAFAEMRRVAKPGGRIVCLEVAKPKSATIRFLHQFYFNNVVPILGQLVGGAKEAYTYLPDSAKNFPPPPQLKLIMEQAGLQQVRYHLMSFGAVAVHTGLK
jgi:demethylmenaquinone methyltransferase/2-methoxy-6-polyprenyl-1,4-benzoquinol methylase